MSLMSTNSTAYVSIDMEKLVTTLDSRYERYATRIGDEIRDAAILVFTTEERKDNEERLSEFTPPHYIDQFRVNYYRDSLKVEVSNEDPGWYLVEFGYHPGGDPAAYVRPYRPLRNGLMAVIVRNQSG